MNAYAAAYVFNLLGQDVYAGRKILLLGNIVIEFFVWFA